MQQESNRGLAAARHPPDVPVPIRPVAHDDEEEVVRSAADSRTRPPRGVERTNLDGVAVEVRTLQNDAGTLAITAFISPYITDRNAVRRLHDEAGLTFLEVYVDAPIAVCEARDPKGMYKRARAGAIKGFTGIDDPYEAPEKPELVVKTALLSVETSVAECLALLDRRGLLLAPRP